MHSFGVTWLTGCMLGSNFAFWGSCLVMRGLALTETQNTGSKSVSIQCGAQCQNAAWHMFVHHAMTVTAGCHFSWFPKGTEL